MKRLGSILTFALMLTASAVAAAAFAPEPWVNGPIASLQGQPAPAMAVPEATREAPAAAPAPPPTGTQSPRPTSTPLPSAAPPPTATPSPSPAPTASPTPTERPINSRALFVDQDAQVMHVYENDVLIRTLPCSTGLPLPYHTTPAWVGRVGYYVGTFHAHGASADDAWHLFRAGGDILIHSAPYAWIDGEKVYKDLEALGVRPSSRGCIRLHPDDARWLTEWNPQGVPIAITPMTRKTWP